MPATPRPGPGTQGRVRRRAARARRGSTLRPGRAAPAEPRARAPAPARVRAPARAGRPRSPPGAPVRAPPLQLAFARGELAGAAGQRALAIGDVLHAFSERGPALRERPLAVRDGSFAFAERRLALGERALALRDGSDPLDEHGLAFRKRIARRLRRRPPTRYGQQRREGQAERERAEQGHGEHGHRSRPHDAIAGNGVPRDAHRGVALTEQRPQGRQSRDERVGRRDVPLRRRNVSKLLAQLRDRPVQLSLERSGAFGDELLGDGVRDLRGPERIVGLGAHGHDVRAVVRVHGHRVEHLFAVEPELHGCRVDDGRPLDEVGDRLGGARAVGDARQREALERPVVRRKRHDLQRRLRVVAVFRQHQVGNARGEAEHDGDDDRLPVRENPHLLVTSSSRGAPVLRAVFRTCRASLDASPSPEEPASSARTSPTHSSRTAPRCS